MRRQQARDEHRTNERTKERVEKAARNGWHIGNERTHKVNALRKQIQIRKIHSVEVYAHPFVHTNLVRRHRHCHCDCRRSHRCRHRCRPVCVCGFSQRQFRNCGGTAGQTTATTLGTELHHTIGPRKRFVVSLVRFVFYFV